MKRAAIKKEFQKITEEVGGITDKKISSILNRLLILVEVLVEENDALRTTVQKQRDEINRLKGERGKPCIRKQKGEGKTLKNHSSEHERRMIAEPVSRKQKKKKIGNIRIDRSVVCKVDRNKLPVDAKFKGFTRTTLQDINVITDNVEFVREVYYSPSLKKSYAADLPSGYHGEFGPKIRTLILTLYNDSGMTEMSIVRFLQTHGIQISKGTVSRMITDNHDVFHQEKDAIFNKGLRLTSYQHIDDTFARVNGKNYSTQILCNELYTAYFTVPNKERLTVLKILTEGQMRFSLNEESYQLMAKYNIRAAHLLRVKQLGIHEGLTRDKMDAFLNKIFTKSKRQTRSRRYVLEASAIIHYRKLDHSIKQLVCDEAPQFEKLAKHKAICWVHAGRHFKKLNPLVKYKRERLDVFLRKFWKFYRKLLDYKAHPTSKRAEKISKDFDKLFSTKTRYQVLDKLIARTLAKKESLLHVLAFPFLPLNNNPAEHGARVQARRRDISLHNKNEKGAKAKDTFATIVQTARKLQVNVYDYIYDRISGRFEMPSLADVMVQKSQTLMLGNTS